MARAYRGNASHGRFALELCDRHDLRTWDHPDLYLVGCGSMPTLGTSNPSPTMGALALRAADNMLKELLYRLVASSVPYCKLR